MTRKLSRTLLLISLLVIAIPAFADIARPKASGSPKSSTVSFHTYMEIVPDPKAYEMRLQMSQETFNALRAGVIEAPRNPTISQRISQSSFRTIIAGSFLFLSIALGGLLLIRSEQKSRRIAAALVIGAAVLGAATIITQANAGPPGYVRWQRLPQALSEGRSTQGDVDIEIVNEGRGIKLIVPLRNVSQPKNDE
jgi:hypothetical protein